MKKNCVYAVPSRDKKNLNFFYKRDDDTIYLFTMQFSYKIYGYFGRGRNLSELRKYRCWNRYPPLDRIIEKRIPYELKNITKGEKCNGRKGTYKSVS